jgi:hypothetical protein
VPGGTRIAAGAPPVDDVTAATRDARWELRWQGWADWPLSPLILVAAALAVALDVTTAWTGISLGSVGGIAVSPALPLVALVVVGIGAGRLGAARRTVAAWREVAIGLGTLLILATVAYALQLHRPAQAVGLVLDALGEELVYRLAAVIVLGACCAWLLRRPWRNPRDWGSAPGFVALGAAAIVFSALPGHVAQMSGPATTVSFASFALVLGYTVLRTGTIWPAVLVHALVNVITFAAWHGAGSSGLRLAVAAVALLALVGGAELAGRRLGLQVRVPTVIDLHTEPDERTGVAAYAAPLCAAHELPALRRGGPAATRPAR